MVDLCDQYLSGHIVNMVWGLGLGSGLGSGVGLWVKRLRLILGILPITSVILIILAY